MWKHCFLRGAMVSILYRFLCEMLLKFIAKGINIFVFKPFEASNFYIGFIIGNMVYLLISWEGRSVIY